MTEIEVVDILGREAFWNKCYRHRRSSVSVSVSLCDRAASVDKGLEMKDLDGVSPSLS